MEKKEKRDLVRTLKVSEQEDGELVAMARQLRLPVQELLRRGGLKEGRRLLSNQSRKSLRRNS